MEPGHLPLLVLLAPLLAASAFFSSAETALFSLTHGDRVRLAHLSGSAAAAVMRLMEQPRGLLISILLANNIVNISYFVVASILAARATPGVALAISTGTLLGIILLGEILPKLFARKLRVEFCRILGPVMLVLHRLLKPIRMVIDRSFILPLSRLLRPSGQRLAAAQVSQEELGALLDISAARGEIDAEEQKLLAEVVELHAIKVREAMIPRQEMPWIQHAATPAELLSVIEQKARLRIPVFRDSQDGQVLGMLDAAQYLAARDQGPAGGTGSARGGGTQTRGRQRPPQITDFLLPTLFVPEHARLDQCLEQFRRQRVHEAICVDELGAIVGMIRIEDILTELVARPQEVHIPGGGPEGDASALAAHGLPSAAGEDGVEVVGPGRWMVPGRLGLRALTEFLAASDVLPAYSRVSTVAGAIIVTLGRVPAEGDTVTIGNVNFQVAAVRARSVERVLVWMTDPAAPRDEAPVAQGDRSPAPGDERAGGSS